MVLPQWLDGYGIAHLPRLQAAGGPATDATGRAKTTGMLRGFHSKAMEEGVMGI